MFPPRSPLCFVSNRISSNQIALSWEDNSPNEEVFIIERSSNDETFQNLIEIEANIGEFSDLDVHEDSVYTYRIYAKNSIGHSETLESDDIVFNLESEISICDGDTKVLDAGPGFSSYLWNDGSNSQSLSISSAGTYSIAVSLEGTCQISREILVSVDDKPVIDIGDDLIVTEDDSVMLDAGAGFESYLWNTGDTTQFLKVNRSGIYSVNVTDLNNCNAFDLTEIKFLNPLSAQNLVPRMTIYPNPVSDKLTLENLNTYQGLKIWINSVDGQNLFYQDYTNSSKLSIDIDISNFNRGIYILKVNDLGGIKIFKK